MLHEIIVETTSTTTIVTNRVARSQQQERHYGMIKDEIACVSSLFIDVLTPECHALCKCQVS